MISDGTDDLKTEGNLSVASADSDVDLPPVAITPVFSLSLTV